MSDDEYGSRRRGRRARDEDEEEEEDDDSSMRSRRRRGRDDDDEEEEAPARGRRGRRQQSEEEQEEEEEEEAPRRGRGRRQASEEVNGGTDAPAPGTTIGKMNEAKRKKFQNNLLDALFKLAEKKYGRKRPQRPDEKGNAMEDYELYLRSIKAKVKTAQDKLNAVMKQKKDIDAKVATAEKEFQSQQSKYDKAEEEKQNAINEDRDPVLPKDFIVPQRAKKANAGLGAMVLKASAGMWEDKFSAMRSKKTTSNTPEWMAKQKKSDKTSALLKVGQQKTEKKAGGRRRRKDDEERPNPFQMNLKKTGLRKDENEEKGRKAPAVGDEEEAPRRRRGRARDDEE